MATTMTTPRPASAGRRSGRSSARRTFRTIHLILGLSFGIVLVVQGLSGATLVWRPELDRLMLPALTRTDSAGASGRGGGLDQGFATAKAAAPMGLIRMVRLPLVANGTDEWTVGMPHPGKGGEGPRWTVYTSPATGQLLGIRGQQRDALQWLIELHHNLLWGRTGRAIQGYLAVATMLLAFSGLWLWWPASWTPSRFRPRAAARPLHYAIGFWAMWPLLTIATTATYLVWRQPIQRAFGVAAPRRAAANGSAQSAGTDVAGNRRRRHPRADSATGEMAQPPLSSGPGLDAVLAAAQRAVPDARLTMIRFPEDPKDGRGPYTVSFESRAEHYRAAPNSMLVRLGANETAQVIRTKWWRDLPARERFLEWLPRIHQGEFGGSSIRLLWSFTGMMPAVLFISGFLMWRRRLQAGG